MGTDTASQRKYLTLLEYLKNRCQETDDPKEKQRIGSLLNGEADSQVMSEFIAKLKTETAKRLVSRACLTYLTKHVLSLSAELKNIK
jgi:hypothetical protein